jgi:hypothetical protein
LGQLSSIAIASLVVYVSEFQQMGPRQRMPAAGRSRAAFFTYDIEDLCGLAFASIIDGLHASLGKHRRKRPQRQKS